MSDSDSKKQETNEMSTKMVSVYCLQTVSRSWHRLEEFRWILGSLSEFRKHSRSPGRPRLLEFAGHRGENFINGDILHILTKLTQEEIDHFNGHLSIKDYGIFIEKTPSPDGSIGEFYPNIF